MAFIALFGIYDYVHASTLGQIADHSTTDLVNGGSPSQHTWVFTPDANQLFNRVQVWSDGTYTGTQTLQLLNSSGSIVSTGTSISATTGLTTFVFPDYTLQSGSKYALRPNNMYLMGASYNGATDYDPKGCKEYAYTSGALGTCGSGNTQTKADIYVAFSWIYTFNAPIVSIVYPQTSSSYSDDFSHFTVQLTTNSAISGAVSVNYGPVSASTTYSSSDLGGSYAGSASSTVYIAKTVPLSGAQWAQGVFKDIGGNVLATSSMVYWTNQGYAMTYTGNPAPTTIAPTSTVGLLAGPDDPTSAWYIDCSAYSSLDPAGWFCSIKKGGLWLVYNLLVPHQAFIGFFNWGLGFFHTAFPFNILFAFLNDLSQILSTVTTTGQALTMPVLGASVVLFDSVKFASIMGADNYNMLMSAMGAVIWIVAGLGLYLQAKALIKSR